MYEQNNLRGYRPVRALLFVALCVFFGSHPAGAQYTPSTIVDLVPDLVPSSEEKTLPFFRSQRFEGGTGCTLRYRLTPNTIEASWEVLDDSKRIRELFLSSPAHVDTWWADPALCSKAAQLIKGTDWVEISVAGPRDTAAAITILKDRIRLRLRSIESFTKRFGSPFFRSGNALAIGNRTNLYLTSRYRQPILLRDFQSLILKIDAKLVHSEVLKGCLPGAAPSGAQNCYEPRRMATQFRMALGNITWHDDRCKNRDLGDPICKYQGRYMQASLSMFDERFQFHKGDFFVQRGNSVSADTRVPIYRFDLRPFLKGSSTNNPFHTGERAVVTGDILPQLKKALLDAEKGGHLPPRLPTPDGTLESDEKYIAHYTLGSMNIGYEVTGLSDVTFDIYQLSLTGY